VVLNREDVKKFLGGHEPIVYIHALQHTKSLNGSVSLSNVTSLRHYMLFGLVPAEMEVRVKNRKILQAEFESACKHSGTYLGGLFSQHANVKSL